MCHVANTHMCTQRRPLRSGVTGPPTVPLWYINHQITLPWWGLVNSIPSVSTRLWNCKAYVFARVAAMHNCDNHADSTRKQKLLVLRLVFTFFHTRWMYIHTSFECKYVCMRGWHAYNSYIHASFEEGEWVPCGEEGEWVPCGEEGQWVHMDVWVYDKYLFSAWHIYLCVRYDTLCIFILFVYSSLQVSACLATNGQTGITSAAVLSSLRR